MRKTPALYIIFSLIACMVIFPAKSQRILNSISKNNILIGQQFIYKAEVTVAKGTPVDFFAIPDSAEGFEIVYRNKPDTFSFFDSLTISQQITFTSFDSGRWVMPAYEISKDIYTDTFAIQVGYSPSDSSNAIRDIKPVLEPIKKKFNWWLLIAGVFLLMVIGLLLYFLLRRKKTTAPAAERKVSPYTEAMQQLQLLKTNLLQTPAEIKEFHSRLSTVFKKYYSLGFNKPAEIMTTDNFLIILSGTLNSNEVSAVAAVMRCNDAVKFAKYIPETMQSKDCLLQIEQALNLLEKIKKN